MFEPNPGVQCAFEHRVVEIDGPISAARIAARDMATGELLEIPVGQLRPLRARAEETKHDSRFVPRKKWESVVALAQRLGPLARDGKALSGADADAVAAEFKMSVRTVRRRFLRLRHNPRASDLLPAPCGRTQGARLGDPEVETIISECIDTHYLKLERPSIAHLMEQIRKVCRERKLPVPSRGLVTRRVDAIPNYERERRRKGARAAAQRYVARPGNLSAERPLQIVQIDHTLADVMLVSDDDERTVLQRPWVTVAIDVCTRCILGIYVSFDAPSSTSVALCLEHVMLPKDTWLAQLGVDANWPMYGRPELLLLDNGKDFHGEALRRGCDEFLIALQYRPVLQPHYGAHIERLIGTLMKRVHLLPGTTFSNIKERGDYDSAGKAIMTLREFRAWLIDQITRWYHARGHAGLNDTAPLRAWESAWMSKGEKRVPPVVGSALELRAAFFPVEWRPVSTTGIALWKIRYWAECLHPYVGSKEKLCVRYDPRDVSKILVRTPDDGILEVPGVSPNARAVSLWEHRWHRKQQRKRGHDPDLDQILDQGTANHNAAIEDARTRTRAARRRKTTAEQRRADGIAANKPMPKKPKPAPYRGPREPATVELWGRSQGGAR
jgi:putative transposase